MNTVATDYLDRLDAALRDVPHGVAAEIRAGIAEELASLDPDAAAARIAQLGDPADIAREALDAAGQPPAVPPMVAAPPRTPLTRTRGFAVAAAIVLGAGGFVVPIIGWFAGVVMVLMSAMWRTWEKLVAVLLPFATVVLLVAVTALAAVLAPQVHDASGESAAAVVNPLVPAWYDVIFSLSGVSLIGFMLVPVSGLWLLWRMRGRAAA